MNYRVKKDSNTASDMDNKNLDPHFESERLKTQIPSIQTPQITSSFQNPNTNNTPPFQEQPSLSKPTSTPSTNSAPKPTITTKTTSTINETEQANFKEKLSTTTSMSPTQDILNGNGKQNWETMEIQQLQIIGQSVTPPSEHPQENRQNEEYDDTLSNISDDSEPDRLKIDEPEEALKNEDYSFEKKEQDPPQENEEGAGDRGRVLPKGTAEFQRHCGK